MKNHVSRSTYHVPKIVKVGRRVLLEGTGRVYNRKMLVGVGVSLILWALTTGMVQAQTTQIPIGERLARPWEFIPGWGTGTNPYKIERIETVVGGAISWLLIIAGIITFGCAVWSGVQWISSGGDKQGMMAARSRLTQCITGLAIVAVSYSIILVARYFLGITF